MVYHNIEVIGWEQRPEVRIADVLVRINERPIARIEVARRYHRRINAKRRSGKRRRIDYANGTAVSKSILAPLLYERIPLGGIDNLGLRHSVHRILDYVEVARVAIRPPKRGTSRIVEHRCGSSRCLFQDRALELPVECIHAWYLNGASIHIDIEGD
jgi:hypothetical protein